MIQTQEAPTLYPSEEEFSDPIRYLNTKEIISIGEQYGILKIKPPRGWNPPFALDPDTFKFHTRLQTLSELSLTNRSRIFWLNGFNNYLRMKGKEQLETGYATLKRHIGEHHDSTMTKKEVHLYDLYVENEAFFYKGKFEDETVYQDFVEYVRFLKNKGQETPARRSISSQMKDMFKKKKSNVCEKCGKLDEPDTILICDDCNRNFHMRCLNPILEEVPDTDWFCDDCLKGSSAEYGFEEDFESIYTIREFARECDDLKRRYCNEMFDGNMNPSVDAIESVFWRLVDTQDEEEEDFEVRYGADIHNDGPGEISAFPTRSHAFKEEYSKYLDHPFNLTNLPFAKGSLLNYIKENREQISGMTVPWLYIGSMFSTFCWHKEDHYTLSANYCHMGATKKWYGIPAADCEMFESVFHDLCPDYFSKQPDLLHQLVTLLSPDRIAELVRQKFGQKIRIFSVDQEPNEFVITFPKVYHAGFNCGFNVNEAVNFTMPYWLRYGKQAIDEYKPVKKENVFNHCKLLRNILDDLRANQGMQDVWWTNFEISSISSMKNTAFVDYLTAVRNYKAKISNTDIQSLLDGLEVVDYPNYLKSHMEDRLSRRADRMSGRKGTMSTEEEADEIICMNCKAYPNFKWLELDMLKKVQLDIDKYTTCQESLLPTPNHTPKQDHAARFLKEEDGVIIVQDDDDDESGAKRRSTSSDEEAPVRKSRRLARKSESPVSQPIDEAKLEYEANLSLLRRLKRRRKQFPNYGKVYMCLNCLEQRLDDFERGQLKHCGAVFLENEVRELENYLTDQLGAKFEI
ncbi:hypothetical protein KL935_002978 [Ogataea polymorpha]|nr:hypothetical protein KL935_002978 [Ogataea polymorpha]